MGQRQFGSPTWPTGTGSQAPAAAQAPASNTAAVCTLPATAGYQWKVERIRWSYSGTPTAGSLSIAWTDPVAAAVTETLAITQGGLDWMDIFRLFPPNVGVTITLAAGGSGISGTVYVDGEQPTV